MGRSGWVRGGSGDILTQWQIKPARRHGVSASGSAGSTRFREGKLTFFFGLTSGLAYTSR